MRTAIKEPSRSGSGRVGLVEHETGLAPQDGHAEDPARHPEVAVEVHAGPVRSPRYVPENAAGAVVGEDRPLSGLQPHDPNLCPSVDQALEREHLPVR
jgi:hypothetical protein